MSAVRKEFDRVSEVNILTATKRRWWPFQLLGFLVARRSQWAAENLVRQSGLAMHLKRLNFLHAGRWVALGRFPKAGLDRHQRERSKHRWVLFVADFNQGWRPYFFAFLDSFASGVDSLWGESDGMPDFPLPGTRYETIEWIERQLVTTDYYYAAYPEVSTNEVRCALRVTREVGAYEKANEAEKLTYGELPVSLRRSLQPCLIPIAELARPEEEDASGDIYDGSVGLVACFAVRPDEIGNLKQTLKHQGETDTMFSRVGGVHFARLFLIDRHGPIAAGQPLKNNWLVLSVVFDAVVAEIHASGRRSAGFLDGLRRQEVQIPRLPDEVIGEFARRAYSRLGGAVEDLWGRCLTNHPAGEPIDEDDFVSIVRDGTVRNLLVYADYPDVTLIEIEKALRRHHDLMASATGSSTAPI